MLNRIAISGGSFQDWMEAVYDTRPYDRAESPVYEGGLSKELVFQELVSSVESGDKPQGNLAGKGTLAEKRRKTSQH